MIKRCPKGTILVPLNFYSADSFDALWMHPVPPPEKKKWI